jgi:hypothetical protein
MPSSKPLIFLSHAAEDGDLAKRLKERLQAITSKTVSFYLSCDRESLPAGDFWPSAIIRALEETDIMFVLVSHHSEKSQWIPFEAGFALSRNKPVVPVLFPGYPGERLKPPLQLLQHISIESPESLSELIQRLNQLLHTSFPTYFSEDVAEAIFGKDAFSPREHPIIQAWPLASRKDLYTEIINLVRSTKKSVRIRATSTLYDTDTPSDSIFDQYISAVAERIAEGARRGSAADYTLVMSFRVDESGLPPLDRQESIRNRQRAFEKAGVGDRITVFQTPERWRMDVMLIGEDHLIIGFPGRLGDPRLHHGIRISGGEFVTYISQWFDLYVRPDANLVDLRTLKVAPHGKS